MRFQRSKTSTPPAVFRDLLEILIKGEFQESGGIIPPRKRGATALGGSTGQTSDHNFWLCTKQIGG